MRDKNNLLQELLSKTKKELKEVKEKRPTDLVTYAGALARDKRLVNHVPSIYI